MIGRKQFFFEKKNQKTFTSLVALFVLMMPAAALADVAGARVRLVTVAKGRIPDIVTAYGSAIPALEGGNAISLPEDGKVAGILVTPGDKVHAGDRLMIFNLSAAGVSTYQQAVSAFTLAQSQRSHSAQLLGEKLATRDQLAQADKTVFDAKATLDALRRQGGDKPNTDVRAPYDGIVNTIPVAQGDRVVAGAPLMTLTRLDGTGLDGLVVTVGIEPALHARLHAGQTATLRHLDGNANSFSGKVLRVDGIINGRTHLVDVDIGVPPGSVLSGEPFAADITLGTIEGWIVPHDAVLSDDRGDYLFQARGGKAVRVVVQELGVQGDTDAVSGKLDASLPVITDGNTQLSDGGAIQTTEGAKP